MAYFRGNAKAKSDGHSEIASQGCRVRYDINPTNERNFGLAIVPKLLLYEEPMLKVLITTTYKYTCRYIYI